LPNSAARVYVKSGVYDGDEYGAVVEWCSEKNLPQVFVRFLSVYVGSSFSVSFHQYSIIILMLILLLSEGAAGEAVEPSQNCVLLILGSIIQKITFARCL
jgi:hypothetical protein